MLSSKWLVLSVLLFATSAFAANDAAVSKALEANLKSLQLLESLAKKSEGTPRERDVLVRTIESLIQIDQQTKQKKLSHTTSTKSLGANLPVQQKLLTYTTRFIAQYPRDPMATRAYTVRARAREELGDFSGQLKDLEIVYAKADPASEEWLKAVAKLGEIYRKNGDLAKSEKILNEGLKNAKKDWSQFVLESLLQTQNQARAYDRASFTLNQLISKLPKDSAQREGLMASKGQLLAKLLVMNKISLDNFFKDVSKDTLFEQVLVIKTTLLEITVVNNEQLAVELVQHPTFKAYQTEQKIQITADLASLLYEQKAYEAFLLVLTEMQGYEKIETNLSSPHHAKTAGNMESALKKLTELSQKIQSVIAKDSKLARQSEGKALELLYAIIGKINTHGDSINAEAKYNKASLYLVQDRPQDAYLLFKELGNFRDAEEKFHLAMIRTFKKSKLIPENWPFQRKLASENGKLPASAEKDLEMVQEKYCASEKFDEGMCFDSLKGLMAFGKSDKLETTFKSVIFDQKRNAESKEHSFSALFDYYQANQKPELASQILNLAQKNGVQLSHALRSDAKKSVRDQVLASVKKKFDEGKNAEVIEQVKKFETENDQLLFAELFAYAGLAAQKTGQDSLAQSYYEKFDEHAEKEPRPDPAFKDLVAVGHALAYEKTLDFSKASYWWTTVKSWTSPQKKLALNSIWIAADYPKFKTMTLTPGFCSKQDEVLCEEYKKLFVATWPVYAKDFQFAKNTKPKDPLEKLVQLSLHHEPNPTRLAWIMELHNQWNTMEPIRQMALYPNFQKFLKAEISAWVARESAKFSKVRTLMDFQVAMKKFKAAEDALQPLNKSHWSDFQVYADVAISLSYAASVEALNRAKTADQAVLDQDPSIKSLFEETSKQLTAKHKELMERGIARTQNYSLDLSLFEGLTQKYPQWIEISKAPVKSSASSFYNNLNTSAKNYQDHWQAALKSYNWAKASYCVMQMHADQTVPQDVAQTIEAETFLRFGNRIDSQQTIATLQSTVKVGPAPASKESP